MGRIRVPAIECNYKEIDQQLKEQFIYAFNDNEMFTEIITGLTKTD